MGQHILLLGATGPSGILFAQAAIQRNHTLTLYVRNPSKLPADVLSSPNVSVIEGTFEDEKGLEQAAACGATFFVSFAGPKLPSKGTPVADCYHRLFPHLIKHNYTRALVLATPSFRVSQDRTSLKWTAGVGAIWLLGGDAYREINAIGEVVTEQGVAKEGASEARKKSWRRRKSADPHAESQHKGTDKGERQELAWTLFRVPVLKRGKAAGVHAGYVGASMDGLSLKRDSLVIWVLDEMEKGEWVNQAPLVCDSDAFI